MMRIHAATKIELLRKKLEKKTIFTEAKTIKTFYGGTLTTDLNFLREVFNR